MKLFYLILILFSINLFGAPLNIGDELHLLDYETQNDEKISIARETKTIIFTSEMEASKIAHEIFENQSDVFLKQKSTVFISDIHKMPFLITKFVALPKMRTYKYTIHLIKEEGPGLIFPREKGKLTVISLDNYKVTSIQFISNSEDLKNHLEKNKDQKPRTPSKNFSISEKTIYHFSGN